MSLREELLRHLGLSTFVVVDLETTGLSPEKDQIIEIGAIKFENGKEVDSIEQLVQPRIPIPEFITRLTGISNEDVKDKPHIEDVFPRLEAFIKDAAFIGQQVNFDASFIEYHFRKINNDFFNWDNPQLRFKYLPNVRIDTLFLSRILVPFLSSYKLADLAKELGYHLKNAHQASADARATGFIFLKLIDRALEIDNKSLTSIINILFANSRRAKSFFIPLLNFKKMKNITVSSNTLVEEAKLGHKFYHTIGDLSNREAPNLESEPELFPIDEENIGNYFNEGGRLSHLIENYERRLGQQQMAKAIAKAFNNESFIIAEAGTGTGKSMAYLLPAIEWALKNRKAGKRVIVSTNTKNLQEQLFFKDIPMVYSTTEGRLKASLLKGRGNYLCLEKYHTLLTDMNQRLSQDERNRVLPLILWAKQTRTGDISENAAFQIERNAGLWSKFIAESTYCPGRNCKYFKDCFLMKARQNARNSDLVVVNHSLLFSDLAAENTILDSYSNLILDEAHNIEDTAANYLGVTSSYWDFRNIYHKLYEEAPRKTGVLQQLDFRISQSKMDSAHGSKITFKTKKLKELSLQFKERVQIYFNDLSRRLRSQYKNDSGVLTNHQIRYHKNFKHFKTLSENIKEIQQSLTDIKANLNALLDVLEKLPLEAFQFQDQLSRELLSLKTDAELTQKAFDFCVKATEERHVYWLEIPANERNNDIKLYGIPLNIAELLQKNLYEKLDTAVFTSATLTVNKKFDYIDKRIGLHALDHKTILKETYGSPFDFEAQISLGVLNYFPDPRSENFGDSLFLMIKNIHDRYKKGMLVLFTSYGLLNKAYDALKPHFDAERILLFAQGKSGSRNNIINQFKQNKDSVLLGTDSFWEGIDVPGDALELLIITKLPFDVPTDPLVSARSEEIKRAGGNPFFEYSVPEAIMKFRQGFGRLIRSKTDNGAVILCDNRLSKMQYGRQFLNSLPVGATIFNSEEEVFGKLDEWFNE
jgi:predicted DnaQ family exonuclease/DinG family helicase